MPKKSLVTLLLFVFAMAIALPLAAQDEKAGGPPPIIQIFREEVKPGRSAAHAKIEAGWPAAFRKAKSDTYYLATTSLTGPSEAWYITGYDSLEAMEKSEKANQENKPLQAELDRLSAVDGELLNGTRSIIAHFVPELSYRPQFKLGEYRYFMLDTVRVRPGHGKEFADLRKAVNAAHAKADLDEHMVVFAVSEGAPAGTYLIFQPAKSLAESDAAAKTHGAGSAYQAAVGDDGRKQTRDFARDDQLSLQRDWLAFSPAMSYLSADTMAAAPDFWSPKPVAAKAAPKSKDLPTAK